MIRLRSIHDSLNPVQRGAIFYFTFFSTVGTYVPFLNVYFVQLGLNGRQIGILSVLFPMMTLVLAAPLAALADRRRRRVRLLQGAIAGYALLLVLMRLPRTFAAIAPLMALLAILFSPVLSIADSLVARMAARHRLDYGRIRLWGSAGFAASAISSGALWQHFGFGPMFILASLSFMPVIWIAGMLEEGPVAAPGTRPPLSTIGRDAGLVTLLVTAFLVGIAVITAITYEGIYMDSLGGGRLLIGMLPGISALSELPTMRYSGVIARRLRGPKTLLLAYGLLGSAFLGYVFARSPWMLLLLAVAKGSGFGLFLTTTIRLITRRAPEEWSATAQAMMTAGMFGLAPLIAGPLGGAIYDASGPAAIFVVAVAAVGLAAVVMLLASARRLLS